MAGAEGRLLIESQHSSFVQENDSRALPPADSHSLEEAQFKTLKKCVYSESQNLRSRIVSDVLLLGYPSLLPDTPGIFALLPSLFTSAVECLSGRLHSTTCLFERDENSLVFLIFR